MAGGSKDSAGGSDNVSNSGLETVRPLVEGRLKSGRPWKRMQTSARPVSAVKLQAKPLKTSWKAKQVRRRQKELVKAAADELKAEIQAERDAQAASKAANRKRREENKQKASRQVIV